ncbi:hypothetical protein [Yaniella halotolerans]|uniref:hypothetical protein n=1 Tax=Yaniella halotolerans TaxID=225453 RepID=UPI0003B43570|nr:hypothetical protein [Yaniella halotolerans]
MTKNLEEASVDVLQQRLLEEIESQQRLQDELKTALESERNLRLENDLLWAYLQRKYPARVDDARGLLSRLVEGGDLSAEVQDGKQARGTQRTLKQKVRGRLGKLPGVHRTYHGIKNIGK